MKIGVYPGSFNPFHVGHLDIYLKAKMLFDKVFIAKMVNPGKNNEPFESVFPDGAFILDSEGVLTDLINELPSFDESVSKSDDIYVVRGFRNTDDVKYQLEQDY